MRVNQLTSTSLSIGQQLKIPVTNTDISEEFQYYTVVRGDSLYAIAVRFHTTVDTIKKLNNLTSNTLSVGQQLKVPRSASGGSEDYIFYVVKAGDTLYSVASKFGMTVDDLKALNNLSSNNLSIGQTLRVIQGNNSGIVAGASCYGEGYNETQYVTYTVRPGDNLYNIAKAYNTSVDNIKLLNNLTTNNLSIGQVLKIKEVR